MDEPEPGEVQLNEVVIIPGEERRSEDQSTSCRCIDCICSLFILGAVIGILVFSYYKALNG
jgi:hypothetical protein